MSKKYASFLSITSFFLRIIDALYHSVEYYEACPTNRKEDDAINKYLKKMFHKILMSINNFLNFDPHMITK